MAEETVPVPVEAEKMEETAAPSTSAEQVEGVEDVDNEAKKLMGAGRRHMVMKDIRSAVNAFQEASSVLGKKYGETADECADAFFSYGMALLELARMENGVLGNALEGMPDDEEEDGEKEEDPNIPSAANLDEGEDAESEEGEDNEGTEEKENDEDDVGNLQLAWEMLDLSKIIFKRQPNKEAQLKAAQAHLKLGEVSVESENYGQAIEDFLACLNIQKEHLEKHDRLLAETHYQLGLAYQYSSKHDSAISHFTQSTDVIEKREALLTEQLGKAAGESTKELQKEMDELKGLLPDIREKIEDSKEAQKTSEVTEKALKETLAGGSSGFSKENGSTSSSAPPAPVEKSGDSTVPVTNCVSDISHLVRKKRKPEEESPLKEAKKAKAEPVANGSGDAVVPTNEEAEKAEEAEKQTPKETPMETAAVESSA
ncbi:PREDICTED: nuclear autoantigenic sperm protein [Nanorana parkeri]|uniref:nuclear autoantigenic sperm protein n=1 Tax=Nanorana parkeri TaxID=125878 RepID=UPI0008542012|nr:PREDICTED: nuclear autoantigenic sperm protein [Nanorana parkeri]